MVIRRSPDVDALSEAFWPCTVKGLAEELWRLNREISGIRVALVKAQRSRDHIEQTVLEAMQRDGIEEIKGDHPTLRVVDGWEYDYTNHKGKRVPKVEFDR